MATAIRVLVSQKKELTVATFSKGFVLFVWFVICSAHLVIFLDLSESCELLLHLVEPPDGRVELGLLLLPFAGGGGVKRSSS